MKKNLNFDTVTKGYDVTALTAYVENNNELVMEDLKSIAPSLQRAYHMHVKNKAQLNYLDFESHLQNGKGCSFDPANPGVFAERYIETALIKKDLEFCQDDLLGFWPEYLVRVPADERDNFPFEEFIIAKINAQTARQMEKIQWQGSKSSDNVDLKWINGWLTILEADGSDAVTVSIDAGTSVYDGLKKVIMNIPEALISEDGDADIAAAEPVYLNIAPALFRQFALEMVDKNYYHYAGNDKSFPGEFYFPGTNCIVKRTQGLTGTLKVVATTNRNLVYGYDVENANERYWVRQDPKTGSILVTVRWNQGAQVAREDLVVVGTFANTPVSPDPAVAQLAAIAASVEAIADNTDSTATAVGTLASADHVYKTQEQTAQSQG